MGKSTRIWSFAQDMAAARGMDLLSATDMLVKVEGGRYIALSKTLGVSKEVIASFKTTEDAVKFLADRYQGSAAAAAETFQGKIRVLTAQMEDLGIKIGLVLIPIIESLGSAIASTVTFFEEHKTIAAALAVVIGGALVAAMTAYIATTLTAFATTGALGVAMTGLTSMGLAVASSFEAAGVAAGAGGGLTGVLAGVGISALAVAGPLAIAAGAGYALHRIIGGTVTEDMVNAIKTGKEWGTTLVSNSSQIADTGAHLDQLKASLRDVKAQHVDNMDAAIKQGQAEDVLKGAIKNLEGQMIGQEIAAAATKNALDELASGALNTGKAYDAAVKAVQALQNELLAAQGGEVGYQQAQLNVLDAQDKLNKATTDYGPASREAYSASLNLQQANLAASGAAVKLSDDNQKLADTLRTQGVSGLELMRQKLEDQVAAHGDASGAIQGEINKISDLIAWLGALPASRTTDVNINVHGLDVLQGAVGAMERLSNNPFAGTGSDGTGLRAAGGPVSAGSPYIVGEEGPELFVPGASGTIIPHGASSGSSAGGGQTIVIPVYVGGEKITEIVVSDLNRAGGPKILQSAVI